MNASPGGCAQETATSPGAPAPVDHAETVLYFVRLAIWLGWNSQGEPYLLPTAIRKEDIEAKKLGKSVSVYRESLTALLELSRRGCALNLQPEWIADPVAARAAVLSLRQLTDVLAANWRLVCVNADPTTAVDDPLGGCPTHASVVRSDPKPGDKQRMQWLLVQSEVAAAFNQITHLSGAAATQI